MPDEKSHLMSQRHPERTVPSEGTELMHRSTRFLIAIPIAAMLFTQVGIEAARAQRPQNHMPQLEDLTGHEAEKPAIQSMVRQGIMRPLAPGEFGPDQPLTRGQFALMIQRMFNLRATGPTPYKDIRRGSRLYTAVAAAGPYLNWQALCFGCMLPNTFQPNRQVSRAEMAVTMVKILGARHKLVLPAPVKLRATIRTIPHKKEWGPAALPYFAIAIRNNLVPLGANRKFAALSEVTRAQTAVIASAVQKRFNIRERRLP